MSLNWDWSDKLGTATVKCYVPTEDGIGEGSQEINLYGGNALFIGVYEYTNTDGAELYRLSTYAADETHLKRNLGLVEGYEACLDGILSLDLDLSHPKAEKILKHFIKARKANVWSGDIKAHYPSQELV